MEKRVFDRIIEKEEVAWADAKFLALTEAEDTGQLKCCRSGREEAGNEPEIHTKGDYFWRTRHPHRESTRIEEFTRQMWIPKCEQWADGNAKWHICWRLVEGGRLGKEDRGQMERKGKVLGMLLGLRVLGSREKRAAIYSSPSSFWMKQSRFSPTPIDIRHKRFAIGRIE